MNVTNIMGGKLRKDRPKGLHCALAEWLEHRLPKISEMTVVPWPALAAQFGSKYVAVRDFKRRVCMFLRTDEGMRASRGRVMASADGLVLAPAGASHAQADTGWIYATAALYLYGTAYRMGNRWRRTTVSWESFYRTVGLYDFFGKDVDQAFVCHKLLPTLSACLSCDSGVRVGASEAGIILHPPGDGVGIRNEHRAWYDDAAVKSAEESNANALANALDHTRRPSPNRPLALDVAMLLLHRIDAVQGMTFVRWADLELGDVISRSDADIHAWFDAEYAAISAHLEHYTTGKLDLTIDGVILHFGFRTAQIAEWLEHIDFAAEGQPAGDAVPSPAGWSHADTSVEDGEGK